MASTPSITIDGELPLQADSRAVAMAQKRNREVEKAEEGYFEGTESKRLKTTVGSVADEFICPITTELPFDPVTAEDGRIYERTAIEMHIRVRARDLKSPVTNEPMGPRLSPAVQNRNAIRLLVESGAINGELSTQWRKQAEEEANFQEAKKKAENGDPTAMCDLGAWYYSRASGDGFSVDAVRAYQCDQGEWWYNNAYGGNILSADAVCAYQWYKKAADLRHPIGMTMAGRMLLSECGVWKNIPHGVALVVQAATTGCDIAAYTLGEMYHLGRYDVREDSAQAKYWLQKAVGGACSIREMGEEERSNALGYLYDLDQNP